MGYKTDRIENEVRTDRQEKKNGHNNNNTLRWMMDGWRMDGGWMEYRVGMYVRKNCSVKVREEVLVRIRALPPVRRHVILCVPLVPARAKPVSTVS